MCYIFEGVNWKYNHVAQFEEGDLLYETRDNTESNDYDSIMPLLLSEEDMYDMDYGDESYHDLVSTEMLENIRDGSQSYPNVNQKGAHYKIRGRIRQRQS